MVALLTFLSGCFSTPLSKLELSDDIGRLVDSAEVQMPLFLTTAEPNDALGFQFLLFIPVTRVYAPHLESLVRSQLTIQAGFGKHGLVAPTSASGMQRPRLVVSITDSDVNGYDLLFVRRPSASVTLLGQYHSPSGVVRECVAVGESSSFSAFAFEKELNHVLEQASERAAYDLVSCLGLDTYNESK